MWIHLFIYTNLRPSAQSASSAFLFPLKATLGGDRKLLIEQAVVVSVSSGGVCLSTRQQAAYRATFYLLLNCSRSKFQADCGSCFTKKVDMTSLLFIKSVDLLSMLMASKFFLSTLYKMNVHMLPKWQSLNCQIAPQACFGTLYAVYKT